MRQCLARITVLLVVVLTGWLPALAAGPIAFTIPAQPLDQALHAFSQQSGMAVLVDRELTGKRRSMHLHGHFSARAALQRLLEGTGLTAHYSAADAFTVQPIQLEQVKQGTRPNRMSAGNYAQAIQQAVERAMCRSVLARPGNYRAALQVWIDAQGVLVQSRLLASTGNEQRDAAVVESLRALLLERPPPSSMAQPVTLLLRPEGTGTGMDCTHSQGASAA
ncbi:TonB C-terminal domain-containing protein [Pseudomonas fontis]|uniref:TonB C-terminal domain-containing protein n=1 Tax=Pseudomonas fontis TaxID=2942633 RepID=A0ABT5NPW4_9PSED|nr:TonB C-terminal domain-containing protein [Pseudomonas fontis]MDD0974701.1 TonB C-terminal domain-containing protein [Pseudomonas fontis]MDD0990196.1 TonB C-terminal domain-containing protein [Pseudomonas fontis]